VVFEDVDDPPLLIEWRNRKCEPRTKARETDLPLSNASRNLLNLPSHRRCGENMSDVARIVLGRDPNSYAVCRHNGGQSGVVHTRVARGIAHLGNKDIARLN
jgi:hypothetical protein